MMNDILEFANKKMEKAVKSFEDSLATIRTGKANAGLLDGIEADYYGSPTPINQIAGISIMEGRQVVIKPFDSNSLKDIEKAIYASDIGITPQNDGMVIRLNVPPLTAETRKDLCKKISKFEEEAKIAIRNIRREANELAKEDDELTEDLEKKCLEKIQKETDSFIKKIEVLSEAKEKEIMTI